MTEADTPKRGKRGTYVIGARALAARPVAILLVLHVGQLAFLLWLAASMRYCCDATYYARAASRIFSEGLLYNDEYFGYRTYFVPFVLGMLRWPAQWLPQFDPDAVMRVNLCCAYTLASFATTLRLARRGGLREAATVALPVFFNPLVLHQVSLPMQEAIIALFVLPLLVLLLSRDCSMTLRGVLAILCATLAFLIRLPMAWMAIACLCHLLACMRWRIGPREPFRPWPVVAASVVAVALLAPQSYIAYQRLHTLAPYVLSRADPRLVVYGIDIYRHDTVVDKRRGYGVDFFTQYRTLPDSEKNIAFYFRTLPDGPLLALAHVWITLHPWSFRTYLTYSEIGPHMPVLVFSSAIVFLALLYFADFRSRRAEWPTMILLFALVVLSSASIAPAAAETRFGLIGFAAAGVAAARMLADERGRAIAVRWAPALFGYVGVCVMLARLLAATR